MLASSSHRAIKPPSRQSIEPASSLHRASIEPALSRSIEPASSFQHRASRPGAGLSLTLSCLLSPLPPARFSLRDMRESRRAAGTGGGTAPPT